jgi:hypothetical protein
MDNGHVVVVAAMTVAVGTTIILPSLLPFTLAANWITFMLSIILAFETLVGSWQSIFASPAG